MKNKKYLVVSLVVTAITAVTLFFQNCSDVSFSNSASKSRAEAPLTDLGVPESANNLGLSGGHFDLDTSSKVYPADRGDTDHHIHEYDDKFNVTGVDYFNLHDNQYTTPQTNVTARQKFIIIVANSALSPGGVIEINGVSEPVVGYQQKVQQYFAGQKTLAEYTLTDLKSLKINFAKNTLNTGGLIPTQTGCVVKNNLGKNGEYRNGALIIQILDAATAQLDPKTQTATASGGLLWESTIFWHKENAGCYL